MRDNKRHWQADLQLRHTRLSFVHKQQRVWQKTCNTTVKSNYVCPEKFMAKKIWIVSVLAACFATFTAAASADSTMSWDLVGSNGAPACTSTTPCAQVTLDVNGNLATFTVTSLFNGWVFDTFGFNAASGTPPTPITLTLVPGSGTGEVGAYSLGGSGNEDGWGDFLYNFETGKHGGSSGGDCVVTGGHAGPGCTFGFQVQSTSALTLADFEVASSGGTGSGFFAGHEASSTNSGYSGNSQPIPPPISEPAALAVVVPGLLVALGQLRRRVLLV